MISLARYRAVLRSGELRGATLSSILGRLPIGMAGLALMLATQEASGSFSRAGAITGAYIAGLAFLAPLLGRRIDRDGPRGILTVCAFVYPAMLCALVACLHFGAPSAIAFAIAFVAGATYPPITVCMRAFLRQRLGPDDPMLSTAYSLESLIIETIFIAGPALVALFVATHSASAAVVFAALSALVGTALFLRSPALAQWRIEPRAPASLFGPLAEPGFPALLFTIVLYASAFGMVEIGITGHAAQLDNPALAGVLLALMSVGSASGALAYGSRSWHAPLRRQFAGMLFLMGAGIACLGLIAHPWWFAALSVLAGIVMAPALIIQSMLVARLARAAQSTEAFTWSSTALLAGVSGGIAIGGAMLETAPPSAVFIAAGAASLLAAAASIALLRSRG